MSGRETIKKTLRIVSQHPLAEVGKSTLYAVAAEDEDGREHENNLRTFSPALPTNELIEFEMTAYDHPEYGRTWTIKGPPGGLSGRVQALETTVAELRTAVAELTQRVNGIGGPPEPQVHPAQQQSGDGLPKGPSFGL